MAIFGKQRAVGLDVGAETVRALVLEGTAKKPRITGTAAISVGPGDGSSTSQAIHAAMAKARVQGEGVIAAVGGPDVVVRQLTLPPVPPNRVLSVLELQHREFGLLPPSEGILDAQILNRSKTECTVLSVSVPKELVEERQRVLQQAAVTVRVLDVDALALLNAVLYLAQIEAREVLVALHIDDERSLLCILSGRGPVVVRYLDVGSAMFQDRLRQSGLANDADGGRAIEACRDLVRRIADGIRMSLAFYRSEYDRESLPRFMLSGWTRLHTLNRALAEELRIDAPFEVIDPFQAVTVSASPADVEEGAGPEFLQAFGLALRGL